MTTLINILAFVGAIWLVIIITFIASALFCAFVAAHADGDQDRLPLW
mgnify:FL=1